MPASLYRYTELPYLISMLQSKKIVLTNPKNWEDKADIEVMSWYKSKKVAESIYALCMAEASNQTYHHWDVFSGKKSKSGVCIVFDYDGFECWAEENSIGFEKVKYTRISDENFGNFVREGRIIKNKVYEDERELRAVFCGLGEQEEFMSFDLQDFSIINRIIFNPWVDQETYSQIKDVIKNIAGCSALRISKSDILKNTRWLEKFNTETTTQDDFGF